MTETFRGADKPYQPSVVTNTTKPHSNEEIANKLIEAGKQRADWFEPDAEVILASSAKAIVAKALAQKDKQVADARRETVEQCAVTVWNHLATFEDCLEPTQRTNALNEAIKKIRALTPPDQTANPTN